MPGPGDSLLSTAAGCLEKSFRARAMQPSRRVRDSNERHTLSGVRTYVWFMIYDAII